MTPALRILTAVESHWRCRNWGPRRGEVAKLLELLGDTIPNLQGEILRLRRAGLLAPADASGRLALTPAGLCELMGSEVGRAA